MNFITVMLFIFLGMLLIVAFIFRLEILVFFFPQNYNMIYMKELDGNITSWYEKKADDLTFKFRGGIYYMTHPTILELKKDEVKNETSETAL